MLSNLHLPHTYMNNSILHPLCKAVNDNTVSKAMEMQAHRVPSTPRSDIKERERFDNQASKYRVVL